MKLATLFSFRAPPYVLMGCAVSYGAATGFALYAHSLFAAVGFASAAAASGLAAVGFDILRHSLKDNDRMRNSVGRMLSDLARQGVIIRPADGPCGDPECEACAALSEVDDEAEAQAKAAFFRGLN